MSGAGERAESTMRAEFGIPEDRLVMLCASRFAHDKGHAYLVNSLKRLSEITDVPFTMVLAGDGPLLEQTREQVKAMELTDRVIFAGFRKDIKNLYKGSDIYINSSQHEALSFLIIEAMAAGLPVIVTDMGGNRDIVPPDADCGALVVYDDPESMAQAMKRMLEDAAYRSACAAGALRTVEEKFEVGKMCQLTWNVYEKAGER